MKTRSYLCVPALALVLSGCGLFDADPKSAPGTPQRTCEDAADTDPKVRNFWSNAGSNANPIDFTEEYKSKREDAIRECLRIRSGRPAGGVEKVIK
jgi:hypothetical protein